MAALWTAGLDVHGRVGGRELGGCQGRQARVQVAPHAHLLVVKAQRSDDRIRRIRSPRAPWMCNREASRLCSYAEAEAHLRGDVLRRGWWDAALSCLTIGRWAGRTAGRRMYSCPPL